MTATPKREPSGKYYDDFEVGAVFVTPRRTVTQTDIVNFACLSGDFNPPHVDHDLQDPTIWRTHRTRTTCVRHRRGPSVPDRSE